MLKRMHDMVGAGESFAFETTCSGRAYIPLLQRCQAEGWRITLLYHWLPSPKAALDRVARRVREGGHGIPPDVVVRRYSKGIANMLGLYLPLADIAAIYDNGDKGRSLIAERDFGGELAIFDSVRWAKLQGAAS